MKDRLFMMLALLCLCTGMTLAQTTKVTGVVTSAEDGEPIVGASVLVEGTTVGTITDINGLFTIAQVPAEGKSLLVSYLGMMTQKVEIKKGKLQIVLKVDSKTLDEVVVTAQGLTRKQKALGYSTQKLAAEDLTFARQTDLGNSMAGKVSGARFYGGAGASFDSGAIVLRGAGSIGELASEPIYVVDGAITNRNSINMDDVESINVLKGPAATALYGSRGGNGAIVITTKNAQGEKGTFHISHTLQAEKFYNHYKLQNQYGGGSLGGTEAGNEMADIYQLYDGPIESLKGAYVYDYANDESWGARFDPQVNYVTPLALDETSSHYGKPVPWKHGLDLDDLFRTGLTNTTNVSFAKSMKDFNARISFTNSRRTGIQHNSEAIRRYLGVKTAFKPTPWMNVNLDYKYTYRMNHNAAQGEYNGSRSALMEYTQFGHTNVDLSDYKDFERPDGSWRTWNIIGVDNFRANFHDNPFAIQQKYNIRDLVQWHVFSGDVSFDLPYNLKAGLRVNGNIRNDKYELEAPSGSINFKSRYRQSQASLMDWLVQGRLTWGGTFLQDRLAVDAALFIEGRDYRYDSLDGSTNSDYNLSIDDYFNMDASTGTIAGASNYKSHFKERSIYATATLGWDDTYFLDGSIRNDMSSTLSPKHNSYWYGGLSASVLAHKWLKAPWLSFWKLRASAAQVGSTIGVYNIYPTYALGDNFGSHSTMYEPSSLKNMNIEPSISTSYEVGTEFRLFDNRIWGDINFYNRDNKNQIISVTSAPQSGFSTRKMNAGLIRNRGIEISLGGMPIKTRNWMWELNFNIAKNKNTLIELAEGVDKYVIGSYGIFTMFYNYAMEGRSMGVLTGNTWNRDEQGRIIFRKLTDRQKERYGGEYVPTYNSNTTDELGNFHPDFTGGFSTSLRYKNFSFAASFDFSVGGQIISFTNTFGHYSGVLKATAATNDRGVNVREPVSQGGGVHLTGVDQEGNPVDTYVNANLYYHTAGQVWEQWVYDRTYVKLREVSLGYQVPAPFLKKLNWGLTQASLSLVATNPWLVYSACPNIDPSESGAAYYEGGQAAPTRSMGFTVSLTF